MGPIYALVRVLYTKMNKWQKYWLYFIVSFSLIHLVRDIFQDTGVQNILSTTLVKINKPNLLIYHSSNTYFIEIAEIIMSLIVLKRKKFGYLGYSTIALFVITIIGFLFYWFYF